MPSSQQRLSTQTNKGAAASAFTFSVVNSVGGFLAKRIADLGSAIPFRRGDDMTKPGNVGAHWPMNTLNNNVNSRTPLASSSTSRPPPSSPPAAKRQKLDENNTHPGHSCATFAVIGAATPPKRSIECESIPDSQRSVASNKSTALPGVVEYRHVENRNKRRRYRKNRDDSDIPAERGSSVLRLIPPQKSEELSSEDEVDVINHFKKPAVSHQHKRKQPEEHPIEDYASRFQRETIPTQSKALQVFGTAVDNTDKLMRHRGPDPGPDELGPSDEDNLPARPTKRPKTIASSLSSRGNIQSTKFVGASTAKSSSSMDTKPRLADADAQKENADTIIRDGLRITRGVSGNYRYQAMDPDAPDYCALSIREIGHTLFPVDHQKEFLKPYRYLTLDIKKTKTVVRSSHAEKCLIVAVMSDSVNLSNGASPKLMIEFASELEYQQFLQWIAVYKDLSSPKFFKDCPRAKLEKDLDEMIQRAEGTRILSDQEIEASTAEDIRVMQHNHQARSVRDNTIAVESKGQPRLKDAMKSSPTSGSNDGVRVLAFPVASVPRQRRTGRSGPPNNEPPESPELEPTPEGWTSLNAGWEKQWRNSLVYPKTGKNRATVDKDDIQRLDEGQFLNDNLIIFYLRYLQDELEKKNPALAERIYFQNTFFYDKLKPTKHGQGINYDSVKNWTSKVDLFSKDYIIVPINEYTHWYVAIICNAPKLLSSSNSHEPEDTQNEVISIIDGTEPSQGNPATPSSSVIVDNIVDNEQASRLAREEVVESLRRMSIDSSDRPNGVTKQKAGINAGEETNAATFKYDSDLYVIKNPDRPEAEVEHVASTANTQRHKKPGKKPTGGFRKSNPNLPRIITLDSLGTSHSPTCSYLKQYLVAEARDKKGIEITPPNMGTTAKGAPQQTNHCDCGLFLLGYIQRFLRDPDDFVKCLLQRDGITDWSFDPSKLRNSIRELIFDLQKTQQANEDEIQERKRQAKVNRQSKKQDSSVHTAPQATRVSETKVESAGENHRGDETSKTKSSASLPHSLAPVSRRGSAGTQKEISPVALVDTENTEKQPTSNIQKPAPGISDGLTTTRQTDPEHRSNIKEIRVISKLSPTIRSPCEFEPTFDHNTPRQASGVSPISPVKSPTAIRSSISPATEASSNLQASFLPPLGSVTPSSKGSRGATPLDPVVVEDLESKRNKPWQSPQGHRKGQTAQKIVVEIPSKSTHSWPAPGQDIKTEGQKQTLVERSPYFSTRQPGDRVTAATVLPRSPHSKDAVIDLSDD